MKFILNQDESLTIAELKEKLKNRNLPTGSKTELLKRLLDAGVLPEELMIVRSQSKMLDEPQQGLISDQEVMHNSREVDLLRRE